MFQYTDGLSAVTMVVWNKEALKFYSKTYLNRQNNIFNIFSQDREYVKKKKSQYFVVKLSQRFIIHYNDNFMSRYIIKVVQLKRLKKYE